MASSKVTRAIAAFEKAVYDKAFIGTFPVEGDSRTIIERNYVKARAKLERLMENV